MDRVGALIGAAATTVIVFALLGCSKPEELTNLPKARSEIQEMSESVLAKAQAGSWTISVISKGEGWKESCSLDLIAEAHQIKRTFSLKQNNYFRCALHNDSVKVMVADEKKQTKLIFFEAVRGGDGDHTGPIVEVFRLTDKGFKKLGEKEMYGAVYHYKDDQLISITGKVLYSLCPACDDPDVTEPEDLFWVPSIMTVESGGVSMKPTLSIEDRKILLKKFDVQVKARLKYWDDQNEKEKLEADKARIQRDKKAESLEFKKIRSSLIGYLAPMRQ